MISHALVKLFDSSTNETIVIVSKNFTTTWRTIRNEQQGAGTVRKLSKFENWVDARVVMWHNSVRTNVQLHTGQSTESFAKCHRPNNRKKPSRQRDIILDSESRFETSIIFEPQQTFDINIDYVFCARKWRVAITNNGHHITQTPCHLMALVQSFTQVSCYSSAF